MLVFTMKVKVINMGSPIIHQIIGQRAYVKKNLLWPFKKTVSKQLNVKYDSSGIRCWDLNSQPLDLKYAPITTRPGLLTKN